LLGYKEMGWQEVLLELFSMKQTELEKHNKDLIQILLAIKPMTTDEVMGYVNKVNKLYGSLIETERKKSYAEGIRMLEWRINCDTLITELYGWKGVVDMAVEESFEREGGTEQRKLLTQTKGDK